MRVSPKAVYRYPFTVYRLTHLMADKALMHGKRFTVHGNTVSDKMDAMVAGSREPGAILRLTSKAVYRYPFIVYRLSHLTADKVLMHGKRFTVTRRAVSGEMDASVAGSRQPEAILRVTH